MIALSFSSVLLRSAVIQVMALKVLTFLLKMFLEVSKFRSYVKGQWISWALTATRELKTSLGRVLKWCFSGENLGLLLFSNCVKLNIFFSVEELKPPSSRQFPCPICSKYFVDSEIHRHIQNVHGNAGESDPLAVDVNAGHGSDDDDDIEVIDPDAPAEDSDDPLFVGVWSTNFSCEMKAAVLKVLPSFVCLICYLVFVVRCNRHWAQILRPEHFAVSRNVNIVIRLNSRIKQLFDLLDCCGFRQVLLRSFVTHGN